MCSVLCFIVLFVKIGVFFYYVRFLRLFLVSVVVIGLDCS